MKFSSILWNWLLCEMLLKYFLWFYKLDMQRNGPKYTNNQLRIQYVHLLERRGTAIFPEKKKYNATRGKTETFDVYIQVLFWPALTCNPAVHFIIRQSHYQLLGCI
jgi:hypothetical protein